MPMTLAEALTAALDDECRARATYRAVLAAFGDVRPFINIVESEERHIQALRRLCERYGVEIPPDPWPSRVSAPESLAAAFAAAVAAERENDALYQRLIEASVGRAAFERALARERGRGSVRGPGGGGRRRRRRYRGGGPAETG